MTDINPETVDAKSMEGSGSKSSSVQCGLVSEDVQNPAKALKGDECKLPTITTTSLSNKTEAVTASTEIQAVLKCLIKIKKEEPEPSCGPGCCCDICSVKRAAASAPVPSTPDVPQEQQTPTINNTSTVILPPVRIGSCLLCGDSCNGHDDSSSDEEETAATPFLPPPPMSTVEVDKLFSKLTEQDKESSAEPSSVINTEMFLHQKQALNWMINKENSQELGPFWREVYNDEWYNEGTKKHAHERPNCIKGGILADDMGLGKTLTVIALIVTNHINGKPMFMKKESSKKRKASNTSVETISQAKKSCIEVSSSSSTEDEVVIIVKKEKTPIKKEKKAIAIRKRKEEILEKKRLVEGKKSKDPGALFRKIFLKKILSKKGKSNNKAHIKNGKSGSSSEEVTSAIQNPQPSTSKTSHDMMILDDDDDDLSLTSTRLVAASEIHLPMRLSNNRSFSASPTPSGTAKATLIICPLSVLTNWTDQICTHINPVVSLRVYMYYGGDRVRDLKYLSEQDIIITTYPTIANDFRTGSSPLHKIKWLRIILDEGHTIRNKGTMLAKSVLDLESERRWAITGTPIQNRIKDLWTLILFLRLEPFSDVTWWKTSVANLAKNNTELADFRLNTVIKHIAIRRLKDEKVGEGKIVELPPKEVVIQDIELTAEERKHYDMLQNNGQNIIRRYLRHNSVLKHYAHCFAILMRLRQMCLHPKLCKIALDELQRAIDSVQNVDDDDNDNDTADNTAQLIKILIQAVSSGDSEECSVCLEALNDPVITPCAHVFCANCITEVLNSEGLAPMCPMCRAPVDETDLVRVPEEQMRNQNKETTSNDDDGNTSGSLFENSSKITALMSSLEAIRDKDPLIKSVVVSQFTSFLNIIEEHLEKYGFQFLRLDGSMRLEERRVALERFSEPGSATVFLLSMGAGGTGISLTAATRVFLMDPAWNPAVEQQCFDRCHRMGQTQEVIITKYIVMDSVEERMLTLQDQKLQLMTHAFGSKAQSEEDKRRTRVRDIAHLIGLRPAVQRGTQ